MAWPAHRACRSRSLLGGVLRPEHPDVATALNNLAELKKRGKSSARSSSIRNNVQVRFIHLRATC